MHPVTFEFGGGPGCRRAHAAARDAAAHRAMLAFGRLIAMEHAAAHTGAWDAAVFEQVVHEYCAASHAAEQTPRLAGAPHDAAPGSGSEPAPDVRPITLRHRAHGGTTVVTATTIGATTAATAGATTTAATITIGTTGTTTQGRGHQLTPQQFLVLHLLARGYSLEQIGQLCRWGIVDVLLLLTEAAGQLGAQSQAEAVLLARARGLIR